MFLWADKNCQKFQSLFCSRVRQQGFPHQRSTHVPGKASHLPPGHQVSRRTRRAVPRFPGEGLRLTPLVTTPRVLCGLRPHPGSDWRDHALQCVCTRRGRVLTLFSRPTSQRNSAGGTFHQTEPESELNPTGTATALSVTVLQEIFPRNPTQLQRNKFPFVHLEWAVHCDSR